MYPRVHCAYRSHIFFETIKSYLTLALMCAPAGSHVAVSDPGEPTSGVGGPTPSLTSRFPSVLVTWACIWLLRLF